MRTTVATFNSRAAVRPIIRRLTSTYQAPWITQWRPAISWLGGVAPSSAIAELSAIFAAQIRDELAARSLTGERLAVSEIDEAGMNALADAGIETIPGLQLLLECSTIKTADEISCISMAASLSTAGFETTRAALRPGTKQAQIALMARRAIEDAGAEVGAARLLSGPLSFPRGIELHSLPRKHWTPQETYGIRPDPAPVRPDPKPKNVHNVHTANCPTQSAAATSRTHITGTRLFLC